MPDSVSGLSSHQHASLTENSTLLAQIGAWLLFACGKKASVRACVLPGTATESCILPSPSGDSSDE
eukprot:2610010-Prorocentrum_lima.AAC.1